MKLDKEYIDNNYIEIYENIYTKPVLMPKLITKNTNRDIINISYQLVFKLQDIEVSSEVTAIKNEKRFKIRKFEEDTLEKYSREKADKILYDFHKKELIEFLEEFPEYSGVILDDGIGGKFKKFFKK